MTEDTKPTTTRSVVEEYCTAWLAGDTMAVLSLYHEDLVLTWPGRHHLAGVHNGQAAAIDALLALQALTNRVPIEIVEVLEGKHSVMVTVVERWSDPTDPQHSMDVTRVLGYTVADNKLRTCQIYETDQPAIDDWIETAHTANHVELLQRCSAGWAAGDVDAILVCHTDDTVFHNHGVDEPTAGIEATKAAFTALLRANPDLVTVKNRTTFGPSHAVVEYTATATIGEEKASAAAVDVFTFRDGLVARKDTWVTRARPA